MTTDMGDITSLAYNAIRDDDLVTQKYSTPEAILDYLQDESNFKTLSEQLKETMIKAGMCSEKSETGEFVDILYNNLVKQDDELKKTKKRARNNVRRWINGQFKFIKNRSDLIEICFALKLDFKLSTELLNKCGYNGFNIRNAEDATFLYCLLNKRPLTAAKKILSDYNDADISIEESKDNTKYNHSGETTFLMEAQIMGKSSWKNDEEFLNTFLIPNKSKFIAYSTTAVHEYNKLKNIFYLIAIKKYLYEERNAVEEKLKDDHWRKLYYQKYGVTPPLKIPATEVPITFNFTNSLKKHAKETGFFGKICDKLELRLEKKGEKKYVINNVPDVCDLIIKSVASNRDNPHIQEVVSRFLSDVISTDKVLFQIMPSIIGEDDGRKRAYGESLLKDSVMKLFPHRQIFTDFEKNPTNVGQGIAIRKAIVLMYYIAYAYEFKTYIEDYTYTSPIFGNMGFGEFVDGLNLVLHKCKLSPLYPANQFDWLILRSIREFEIGNKNEDENDDSPVAFFNNVLKLSFPDEDY